MGYVTMCPPRNVQHATPMGCCHISLPFFQGKLRKKHTLLIKQKHIIVLDMWKINLGENK